MKPQPWSQFRQAQQQQQQQQQQHPFPQSHPQLEHEYFTSLAGPTNERHFSPEAQVSSIAPSPPSTTLHGAYNPNTQQTHSRTSSFGQSSSLDGVFGQPVYGYTGQAPSNNTLDPSAFISQPVQNVNNQQHGFSFQPPANLTLNAGQETPQGLVSSYLTRSPDPLHVPFPPAAQQQRIPNFQAFPTPGPSTNKRARVREYADDVDEEENDTKEEAKAKPLGACLRCKNLKVRCESRTDTDPCKRCMNSGHECIIPGRKKRRAPPKRETLINEIRRQADEIKGLMAQLEALNAKPGGTSEAGSSSAVQSPVLSPTSLRRGSLLGTEGETSNNVINPETQQVVADWIAKARESFEEFDGFIAGGGLPRSYIVGQDSEEVYSSDDDFGVSEDLGHLDVGDGQDYAFAVESVDGPSPQPTNGGTLHRTPSMSSLGSAGTAGTNQFKRNVNDRSAALPPNSSSAFGLFSDLARKKNRLQGSTDGGEEEAPPAGIANTEFFESTPLDKVGTTPTKDQHPTPHILARGLITPAEAEKLFHIYFDQMNLSISLLDPVMYTAQRTYYRSPFLFTVVCAIASRFYTERPELYAQAMHYAQLAAGTALISGKKNVEMVSAYILLSLYPVPAKRWEDQRSWLYLGLAIRCATDLNLHIPNTAKPINEIHAREMLNRTRVWLNCFNVDRSTGSQYGKPPIINNADYVANHSEDWWKSSPYNMKHFDIHTCAYNAELRVMAGFLAKIYNNPEHPSGLNQNVELEAIAIETDDELQKLGAKWMVSLEQTDLTDPQNLFRTGLLKLAYSYARLGCLSYGFQHALGKGQNRENPFLLRCLNAATDVVQAVLNNNCSPDQSRYLRHGPEAQSVFVTFASAFLVKLLQPKFSAYLTIDQREEIRNLVQKVIDLLGSPEVAIDNRHGPKLYSRFLKGLLAAPMARDPAASPSASSSISVSRSKQRGLKSASQTPDRTTSMTPPPAADAEVTTPPLGRSSLSPAPMEQATDFNSFAPNDGGAIDPFAQLYTSTNDFDQFGTSGGDMWMFGPDTTMGNDLDSMGWGSDPQIPGMCLISSAHLPLLFFVG
ncbi:hypothetical protein BDN72DRAFT_762497 [Pluteus cervinus]|uniref:Uncharacterized protein n=1 Tax=Pluteus cervinus TaxID=181527 RepID=A0ACD3B5J0_9AGAR|nr:hypothetical protein BDN72DRAFT_762497 [Pluteus cervinus]